MKKCSKHTFSKDEQKMLISFFAVSFGGLLLLFPYKFFLVRSGTADGSLYKHFAALLPALGVMLGLTATRKPQKLPWFLKAYSVVVLLEMLCCIGSWIFPHPNWYQAGYSVIYIGSITVLLAMWHDGTETRRAFGLFWPAQKTRISFSILLLFPFLYVGRIFLQLWLCGDLKSWCDTQTDRVLMHETAMLLQLPLTFLLGFLFYFGEEYGWRYFLQPLFQEKFGMFKGSLLVGMVWGVWHTPIDWPSGESLWTTVLIKTLYCMCIGLFFAFAYMLTQNLWLVVMLHFLHNTLPAILFYTADTTIPTAQTPHPFAFAALFLLENLVFAIPLVIYWAYKRAHSLHRP